MAIYEATLSLQQKAIAFDQSQVNDKVFRNIGWEGDQANSPTDVVIPQVYFLQNVMPIDRGYASVHYTKVVNEHTFPKYVDELIYLRDANGNVGLYSYANGANLVYTKETESWVSQNLGYTGEPSAITYAYLKGVTYVYLGGIGVYKYDFDTQAFVALTLNGIGSFDDLVGISAAGSYLLLYSEQQVYWSSPSNPLEFSPLDGGGGQTGAGSSAILANKGQITVVLTIAGGAIVYTTVNAVAMRLTANANFPFSFNEIPAAAGVEKASHVSFEATSDTHFAWTTSGIQLIGLGKAQLAFTELSDVIAASSYSTYSNGVPITLQVPSLDVRVSNVGSRFITFSLRSAGAAEFPLAYILDLGLERWGRLDIPHVDIFEYRKPEFSKKLTYTDLYNTTYASLAATSYAELKSKFNAKTAQFGLTFATINKVGGVFVALQGNYANLATMEVSESVSGAKTPKIVFGRFKLIRPQALNLQTLKCTKLLNGFVSIYSHAQNGQVIKEKTLVESLREAGTFRSIVSGAQISVKFSGQFVLTQLSITAENAGNGLMPVKATDNLPPTDNLVVVSDIFVTQNSEYVSATLEAL